MLKMKKRYSYLLVFGLLALLGLGSFLLKNKSSGQPLEADLYFFYMPGCPHCADEEIFLSQLEQDYPEIQIARYSIFNQAGREKLAELYQVYQVPKNSQGLTPTTFTKDNYFVGFDNKIADDLKQCIEHCLELTQGQKLGPDSSEAIALPFIGQIETSQYSLPVLAVLLGFFDGFNVCSLGALVLILSLVLVFKSRKKVIAFGSLFILTTALVYGALIMIWHQVFKVLLSFLNFFEILIGLLGVGGGLYFFKEFYRFRKQGPACQQESGQSIINRFTVKLKDNLQKGTGFLAVALSILAFAFVITVVEFPCSAAVPLFFAGVLTEASPGIWLSLVYIAIFIFFYMLDELIVFIISSFTLTIKIASPKFTTWLALVEAVVLFLLGFYYLFGFLLF